MSVCLMSVFILCSVCLNQVVAHYSEMLNIYSIVTEIFSKIRYCDCISKLYLSNVNKKYSEYADTSTSLIINLHSNDAERHKLSLIQFISISVIIQVTKKKSRSIQRTQTPPRMSPLTLRCDLELSKFRKLVIRCQLLHCTLVPGMMFMGFGAIVGSY